MRGKNNIEACEILFHTIRNNDADMCSLSGVKNCSQLSTSRRMSQNSEPSFMYHRRKHNRNSGSIWKIQPSPTGIKPSDGFQSSICSVAPPEDTTEKMISATELDTGPMLFPVVHQFKCNQEIREFNNECFNKAEGGSDEDLKIDNDRDLDIFCGNNCSSSNLDIGSASLKIHMDDVFECSSSGAMSAEKVADISERDICISILKKRGLLENAWTRSNRACAYTDISRYNFCSKTCKVCENLETTKNMLICDNCEDAYHVTCCSARVLRIPVGEWLCNSCLKKKHKIQNEKLPRSSMNSNIEIERNGYSSTEGELGSLEFMFRDSEPHMSNVRIGDEFQANVPEWSGPIIDEFDHIGVLIEAIPPKNDQLERKSTKSVNISSIGNWVQCRGTIENTGGVEGTICGKWRRVPLFECQTDDWECFGCVNWDPAHADCAVPQELRTEEIMKQLKYIDTLRSRMAMRKRKLKHPKSKGSLNPQRM